MIGQLEKREMTAATIYFKRNDRKLLEMIVFIANLAGDEGVDIYHLAKIFFYAEKRHLNRYLRPIVGDVYIKMEYGPAPSAVLDLINRNEMKIDQGLIESAKAALRVTKNERGHKWIRAKRQSNEDYFSESDKETIRQAYKYCAARSFDTLTQEGHQELAWQKAVDGREMDYADLIEGPHREELIKNLEEDGPFLAL